MHVHTHDTPGGQLATYFAAWQAGADAVDGASAALAGTTSQPALSAIVAALAHSERDTGLNLQTCATSSRTGRRYGRCTRRWNPDCRRPQGELHPRDPRRTAVQPSQQAVALGFGDRFEDVEKPTRTRIVCSAG